MQDIKYICKALQCPRSYITGLKTEMFEFKYTIATLVPNMALQKINGTQYMAISPK